MRVRLPADRGRLFPSDPTRSRWWYWVAAVPIALAFWLLAVGWVALATVLNPHVGTDPGGTVPFALALSLVALGVPLGVLLLLFPFALFRDVLAVEATGVGWRPDRTRLVATALVGPAVGAAATVLALAGVLTPDASTAVFAAFTVAYLFAAPVALFYLRARRRHVGVP